VRIPASLAAIPLLIGAAAGLLLFDSIPAPWIVLTAAAAILAAASAAASIADGCAPEAAVALVAGFALAGASLGLSAARDAYLEAPFALDGPATLEGRVREDAVLTPSGASLTIDIAAVAPAGQEPVALERRVGARLTVAGSVPPSSAAEWVAGRVLRVTATLRPPSAYRNVGVQDEARALARRGIALVGSAKSAALVEVAARGTAVEEMAAASRAWARRELTRFVGRWSARSSAIAAAILIGDRTGIPDEDERRLQEAGTYHVIAISGGNIAILTAVLLVALRCAFVPGRLASALTIAALLFYGHVTGSPPSVARAITAAAIYLAARVIDHRGPALNALAVAAVGAIAASPATALDAGFILSFGATLGILLGVPRLVFLPSRRHGASRLRRAAAAVAIAALSLLAATICAEAALSPIGAVLFARVTFAGLILNFAAIPLMTVVQAGALATLAAADAAPRAAGALGYVVHLSTVGLVESARLVDVAPWLSVDVIPPAWWLVGAYYMACLVLLYVARLRRAALAAIAAATVLILTSPPLAQQQALAPASGRLRVVFLDVGQGDATLIHLPDGRSLLVDAGGLPGSTVDFGERVVAPALRAVGVRRLDTLVLTHGDPDHAGGAPGIVRRFRPRAIWEGVPVPPHAALRAIAAEASAAGAAWRSVQAGDIERIVGVDLRVWHPPPPDWERQRVRNDDSIVLEIRLRDVSILLPGDIGRDVERTLAPKLSLAPVVILKAPHHGSATSSTDTLIDAIDPAAVIFSCGRRNLFGHPHPAVVERYRAAGVEILRTDQDGAIVVDTDGTKVEVRTYTGRALSLSR
jgi:competence protein ComEC